MYRFSPGHLRLGAFGTTSAETRRFASLRRRLDQKLASRKKKTLTEIRTCLRDFGVTRHYGDSALRASTESTRSETRFVRIKVTFEHFIASSSSSPLPVCLNLFFVKHNNNNNNNRKILTKSTGRTHLLAIRTTELPEGEFSYTRDFAFTRLSNKFAL